MEKIAFIVCQYGLEVNGGAEIHCKMLAERLCSMYQVEVLTSTIISYKTFEPYYKAGEDTLNGVLIRRFNAQPFNHHKHETVRKRSKLARKIRRNLHKIGLLKVIANKKPIWSLSSAQEREVLQSQGYFSPDLLDFVKKNGADYKAIIILSYPYAHTFFVAEMFPERTILIPTAHDEGDLFTSLQTQLFTQVKHIAFNTAAERDFCASIFGKHMAQHSILAVGVDITEGISKEALYEKFNLPEEYVLYFGRVDASKLTQLIPWFLAYKKSKNTNVKLVLTGKLFMDKTNHPDIIYTDFVSEAEKTALIENARLVINPSDKESLSLLLLESMQLGKPSLVNGKSEVMKQHCIASNFACSYYTSKTDFLQKLDAMLYKDTDSSLIAKQAQHYVEEHYNWDLILKKLQALIN